MKVIPRPENVNKARPYIKVYKGFITVYKGIYVRVYKSNNLKIYVAMSLLPYILSPIFFSFPWNPLLIENRLGPLFVNTVGNIF